MIYFKELEEEIVEDDLEDMYDYMNEESLDEDEFYDDEDDDIHEYCD